MSLGCNNMEVRLLFSEAINDTVYILEEFDVRKVSLDEAVAEVDCRPLLAVARQWVQEPRMKDFSAHILETGQHMILLPLWPKGLDVANWLGFPLACETKPGRGSDVAGGKKISYKCVFATALNDGILHTNEAGYPLTIRYQSFSGSGGITVTALDLNFWQINTLDSDQQRVWEELVSWRPDNTDIRQVVGDRPEDNVSLEQFPLEFLLALAVRDDWDLESLAIWSGKKLLTRRSLTDWRSLGNIAAEQGIVQVTGDRLQLNHHWRDALEDYLISQGHYGVMRQLRRGG